MELKAIWYDAEAQAVFEKSNMTCEFGGVEHSFSVTKCQWLKKRRKKKIQTR